MRNNIPAIVPVDPLDRPMIWFETTSALMIQLELKFAGPLDENRLARAALLTLDAEPVLGCRLVHHWRKPYWQRIETKIDEVLQTAISPSEYEAFLQYTIDPYQGPQMRTCLWNDPAGPRLLIKVTHHAADAAGVKDVGRVMASLYARLEKEPGFNPEPNLTRSQNGLNLYQSVPKKERRALKRQFKEYIKQGHSGHGSFRLPFDNEPDDLRFFYTHCTLPRDRVASLTQYGRSCDATLNDLMVAAAFRSQVFAGGWDGDSRLRLTTTIDLRRHLPDKRASAAANLSLSLSFWPNLGQDLGAGFPDTLQKITTATRARKERYFGLDALVFAWPLLVKIPHFLAIKGLRRRLAQEHRQNNLTDTFTNMGQINPEEVAFEDKPVEAKLLPPASYPPYFLLGASGYDGSLTLSVTGFGVKQNVIKSFLEAMDRELEV